MSQPFTDDFENYTYTLACPNEMGGAVFYVGVGRGNRIHSHESIARGMNSSRLSQTIRNIWLAGFQVKKTIVQEGMRREDAELHEMQLIKHYGYDNLVNTIFRGINREIYKVIPTDVRLLISVRTQLEDHIQQWLAEEGLEYNFRNCYDYLERLCNQAVLDKIKQTRRQASSQRRGRKPAALRALKKKDNERPF